MMLPYDLSEIANSASPSAKMRLALVYVLALSASAAFAVEHQASEDAGALDIAEALEGAEDLESTGAIGLVAEPGSGGVSPSFLFRIVTDPGFDFLTPFNSLFHIRHIASST
jgi:hypothetical protein